MSEPREYLFAINITDKSGDINFRNLHKVVSRGIKEGIHKLIGQHVELGEVKIIAASKDSGWTPRFKTTGRKSYPAWIETLR